MYSAIIGLIIFNTLFYILIHYIHREDSTSIFWLTFFLGDEIIHKIFIFLFIPFIIFMIGLQHITNSIMKLRRKFKIGDKIIFTSWLGKRLGGEIINIVGENYVIKYLDKDTYQTTSVTSDELESNINSARSEITDEILK